jgi:hypothetical protein
MNQCDEKHRSPTPKHAATAGIWRHEREGISYPWVVMLSDCTAGLDDDEQRATLENVIQQFGDVLSASDVLALLDAGD